jgi:Xaa-Pro aminopeptidase
MQERGIAGMVVFAHDRYSPAMYYVTGQKIHFGIYFRTADGRAHLIHDPMERDQAEQSGCEHSSFIQHGLQQRIEREGYPARAYGKLIGETCAVMGMQGAIAFFGDTAAGFAHEMLEQAIGEHSGITVDRGFPDILTVARTTKAADELEAIRGASQGAVSAIERVREFLASLAPEGDGFLADGSGPVTLGQIRQVLLHEFVAHGLDGGETIVSQGRDAGVPHNRGDDAAPLRPGSPLLIDIFPSEAGGGYHSDLTRTFCMGPASEELQRIYRDVHDAFRLAMDSLELGASCRSYQDRVCELFERRGHLTLRSDESTLEGYVHGLGHGVGLAVHEAPRLGGPPSNSQRIEPGMVLTIEPGLYYPSRGIGVRIEDLVLAHPDGTFEILTPAPYPLEIEPLGSAIPAHGP